MKIEETIFKESDKTFKVGWVPPYLSLQFKYGLRHLSDKGGGGKK